MMTERDIEGDIAFAIMTFKKMEKMRPYLNETGGPRREEFDKMEMDLEAIAHKLVTQVFVDLHRIADALESLAVTQVQALNERNG